MLAQRDFNRSEPSLYPLETDVAAQLVAYTGIPLVLTSAITFLRPRLLKRP